MLLISELDIKKKSVVKIEGMLEKIIIPKQLGNVLNEKQFKFIEKHIDNKTSILYV
jgi:hypothetical protein